MMRPGSHCLKWPNLVYQEEDNRTWCPSWCDAIRNTHRSSRVLLSKMCDLNLITKKQSGKSTMWNLLRNNCLGLFQKVNVMKDKTKLKKKKSSLKEMKDSEQWNATENPDEILDKNDNSKNSNDTVRRVLGTIGKVLDMEQSPRWYYWIKVYFLVPGRCMLKYLGVECHSFCNLHSNVSEKMLMMGESRWNIY